MLSSGVPLRRRIPRFLRGPPGGRVRGELQLGRRHRLYGVEWHRDLRLHHACGRFERMEGWQVPVDPGEHLRAGDDGVDLLRYAPFELGDGARCLVDLCGVHGTGVGQLHLLRECVELLHWCQDLTLEAVEVALYGGLHAAQELLHVLRHFLAQPQQVLGLEGVIQPPEAVHEFIKGDGPAFVIVDPREELFQVFWNDVGVRGEEVLDLLLLQDQQQFLVRDLPALVQVKVAEEPC
mmetsp:Transcript_125082/g.389375  ORF Transcript_125082/g.389375 Transcript_125082/m.389375 type:complete len:236 (-) Transcript_125082:348-1055(-)